MIKKGFFLCLIFTFSVVSNAQIPKTLDSLKLFLRTSPKDTSYILALNEHAFLILRDGRFDEAKKNIAQMEELTKKLNFSQGFYKVENMRGVVEYSQQNFEKALVYFKKAAEMHKKYNTPKKNFQNALNNISIIYKDLGDRENATKYAMELIDFQEKNKLEPKRSTPYSQIADNLKFYKKYDDALKYYNKALSLETGYNHLTEMAITENSLGNVYDDMKNNQLAIEHYERGLKYAEKEDYPLLQTDFLINLGRMYIKEKQYLRAEKYLKKSEQICKELGNEQPLKTVYHSLGDLNFFQKNFEESEFYYLKALEISKKIADPESKYNANQALAELYEETGNYKNAYNYKKEAEVAKDSMFKVETALTTEDLLKKYETTQKEQQIALLNEKNEKSSLQNKSLLGGLGLLIFALGLLFWNFQTKRKANKTINDKNIVLEKLNNDLQEANQTKAKLFGIISHDLRSPISQVYQFLRLQQLNPNLLSADQKENLSGKIQTATGSLLETMEDLLLWSKTQMNEFNVKIQTTKIKPAIEQCIQLLKLNIDAKNLDIENKVSENIVQETDPYFLQIIVRNLLQNAVKASPENGKILINFENEELTIKNEGDIFTQKQYESAIFSNQKQETLSGLGLKLVAELSQKIGSKVSYETVEKGTCVKVQF